MVRAEPARLPEAIFLMNLRDVDMGGARGGAGRARTVEAAVGFDNRFLLREGRMQIGKAVADIRIVEARYAGQGGREGALHLLDTGVEAIDELVHVGAADIHGGRNAQHVAVEAAAAHEDAIFARGFH